MARVFNWVQKAWAKGNLAGMLLIDVKGVFNHVSRNSLLITMDGKRADRDLVRLTESFMSDMSVDLVIDRHQCTEARVETGVLQRSSVLLILFARSLNGVLREVKAEVK